MRELLAPLQKIGKLIEAQTEILNDIHSVLTIDLKKISSDNHTELQKQTSLLGEIRDLLTQQLAAIKQTNKNFEGKEIVLGRPRRKAASFAIVTMAGAVLLASYAFSQIPEVTAKQLFTALAVAGISVILADIFVTIEDAFDRSTARILADKFTGQKKENIFRYGLGSGAAMVIMGITVLASSFIYSLIPNVSLRQLSTALAVSVVMIPISFAISGVLFGLKKSGLKADKESLGKIAILPLMMTGIALGIVATAWVFKLMPEDIPEGPPIEWTITVGLLVASFAYSLSMLLKATEKIGIAKAVALATFALPALALGIVTAAHIFNFLPDESEYKYIPLPWIVNSAAAIAIMGIAIGLIGMVSKLHKRSPKELLMTTLGTALIGVAILAIAWIFSALPTEFGPLIPFDWVKASAIAITIFAVPFLLVGFLASKGGAAILLYGAAGLILIAATMFVVAWIFSALPDLSAIAQNFTDAIMYPINAMIDALARFKNEIGVENMLPLAGGLFAIAGGWLALTAALAGQAMGGIFTSAGTAISGLIDKLAFWSEAPETPLTLLDKLIARKDGILALATPFEVLGLAFGKIGDTSPIIEGMASILPFTEKNRSIRLENSAAALYNMALSYEKISKASNSMNVDAIEASSRMFEAIAKIAENDGQDAMTILAEKLMEAVERLSETVKDLEDTTSGSAGDIKDAVSGAIENFTKKIMGSKEDTESGNGMLDMSVVVAAIQELEARFDRPILVEDSEF